MFEDLVPQASFEVGLHLREVEVGAAALLDLDLAGGREVEREVDERTGGLLTVDEDVLLGHVPAAGAHDDSRQLLVGGELVFLALGRSEVDVASERVEQVDLALDDRVPLRGVRVFLIGQPHLCAGVERVDRHLLVGRAGDLDAAVFEAGCRRCDLPGGIVADLGGLGEEVEVLA